MTQRSIERVQLSIQGHAVSSTLDAPSETPRRRCVSQWRDLNFDRIAVPVLAAPQAWPTRHALGARLEPLLELVPTPAATSRRFIRLRQLRFIFGRFE